MKQNSAALRPHYPICPNSASESTILYFTLLHFIGDCHIPPLNILVFKATEQENRSERFEEHSNRPSLVHAVKKITQSFPLPRGKLIDFGNQRIGGLIVEELFQRDTESITQNG